MTFFLEQLERIFEAPQGALPAIGDTYKSKYRPRRYGQRAKNSIGRHQERIEKQGRVQRTASDQIKTLNDLRIKQREELDKVLADMRATQADEMTKRMEKIRAGDEKNPDAEIEQYRKNQSQELEGVRKKIRAQQRQTYSAEKQKMRGDMVTMMAKHKKVGQTAKEVTPVGGKL